MSRLRGDRSRLAALTLALAFHRPDVDDFLREIDTAQYQEWLAYFTLNPQGWQATNLATTRITYMLAQLRSRKRLRERDYSIRLAADRPDERTAAVLTAARTEAGCLRSGVQDAVQRYAERVSRGETMPPFDVADPLGLNAVETWFAASEQIK